MKKISLLIACFFVHMLLMAQEGREDQDDSEVEDKNFASFELGSGLNFSFNEGNYQFNIGGFIQPSYKYNKFKDMDTNNNFNSKRTFLIFQGIAVKEKVSFLVQTDYSRNEPLMDAWVAYHPTESLTITLGQKQTFVNNKEMTFREDKLQFTDRSFLSQTLSNTGREFGVFVESKFQLGKQFGIAPMVALTSGDGRNSFGNDSRDTDLGGLKIGGRLDVYPLGYFTNGNEGFSADLMHEESLKFVIGAAASKNSGVSSANGEGHGDFFLFDTDGNVNLPDYSQVYIDLLLKYKGFSFLGELANASANGIGVVYVDETTSTILAPQQISEYLYLGDSYNFQLGYVTKKGLSFDVRVETLRSEFENYIPSLLPNSDSYTFGLTKYFKNNNLKMQASITSVNFEDMNNQTIGEFLVQIVF